MLIAGGPDGSINSWSPTSMDDIHSPADGSGIAALNVEGILIVSSSSAGVVKVIKRYSWAVVANWKMEVRYFNWGSQQGIVQ